MTRITVAGPKDVSKFQPLGKVYNRSTKDGSIPIATFLVGSHYQVNPNGILDSTTDGTYMTSNTLTTSSSKLNITGKTSQVGQIGKNIGSFSSFTYLYPKTKIVGHSELAISTSSLSPRPTHRLRHKFEDIATTDSLIVDWGLNAAGTANELTLKQTIDGVESTVATYTASAGITEINWELRYLEEGVTKFFYKTPSGTRTRLFKGTTNADIAECKVSAEYWTTETTLRTVNSDFLFIWYPIIHLNYQGSISNYLLGNCKVYDTKGSDTEANWIRVYSGDHEFSGDRVIENGLLRIRITSDPKVKFYGWNTTSSSYEYTGALNPIDSNGNLSTNLNDVLFKQLTKSRMKFTIKFGVIDYEVDLHRGWPHARIVLNSKQCRFETSKGRFATSSDYDNNKLLNWNQKTSDDSGKGNPLNLSAASFQDCFQPTAFQTSIGTGVNPYNFTNDTNTDSGLQNIDDNWFAFYDAGQADDTVGFIGVLKKPTGLQLKASTTTALEYANFTFDKKMIIGVGILQASISSQVSGIPLAFHIGNQDQYVKWRANESIVGFGQKQFSRRKR